MTKPRKICHITCAHHARDVRIFHKECVSLANAGFSITLIAPGESFTERGVRVIGIGEKPITRRELFSSFARKAIAEAADIDADIFHLHDPQLVPYGLKLRRRGKVVFDSHENYYGLFRQRQWIPKPIKLMGSPFWNIFLDTLYRMLDGLVVVDEFHVPRIKSLGVPCTAVHNYPLVADLSYKGTHRVNEDLPIRIVFAGGISEQWNHELVLDAICGDARFRYELCGPFQSREYENRLRAHPAWKQVDYYGIVSFERAKEIIRSSDVAVALLEPSPNTNGTRGTMGNTKLFEFMAQGLPVVCTAFEEWKKVIEGWRCGECVDLGSPSSLAGTLNRLSDDSVRSRRMGSNGRLAVQNEYNWEKDATKLISFYESLYSFI